MVDAVPDVVVKWRVAAKKPYAMFVHGRFCLGANRNMVDV